ncbi:EF hand family protein [Rhynchospora pubera]|uniref:EF hand family protein n=1 Tax=Rhynchospora pubera TaxID=906938 RepID=A0AAV8CTD5_9POAL|nr:EF hand family protein [Rhynchospora pubera]
MAQLLGKLWDRAQGKCHVERICSKVFDECSESDDKAHLKLEKLHVATLLVYNSVNKQLFNPHKEPPSMSTIDQKVAEYKRVPMVTIDRIEFNRLMMEWIRKDLYVVLANRAVLAFVAAPALAVATKRATKDVPHVGKAVAKVPTPLLFSLFSVGLVLLQDFRVG